MTIANHRLIGLFLSLALLAVANSGLAADPGLITKQSRYSVKETVERFEAAVVWGIVLGIALMASLIPSWSASRTNPITALRHH